MSSTDATTGPMSIQGGRAGFGSVVWAEWTKFRTIRGWIFGTLLAAMLCVAFTFVVANGNHEGTCTGVGVCQAGHPFVPTGPDGQAVADTYQYLSQPLSGDGSVTARVTSLTGLTYSGPTNVAPSLAHTLPGLAVWAKAGILLTPTTSQGTPYAAVMTTGSHGTHFQYDYTHDRADPAGPTTTTAPSWLRLIRAGDTITGYGSADGSRWHVIGAASLPGLPAIVNVGLFVTSPASFQAGSSGVATRATATFDEVTTTGPTAGGWHVRTIGMSGQDYYPTLGPGGYHRAGDSYVLAGSGDIASAVNPLAGGNTVSDSLWFGLLVALTVLIVIATMFITVEYRRGMIRTTLSATPQRGSVLAGKAAVIAAVGFVVGVLAAAVAIPLGSQVLARNGNYIFPAGVAARLQVIAGIGALLAMTSVAMLALGTIVRRGAGAITAGVVLVVLPYIAASYSGGATGTWLFRLSPAAGFAVLGILPRFDFVDAPYAMSDGYFPLSPLAGLAVLAGYTAVAVGIALFTLRRRDA